uniref:Oxidoreductase n=1 Tax=virus sp. ctmTa7 TaxID=2828255 RepID=A0A8S5RCT8_9VIRU|nr:MAG TPA: oxidoreductase [virus sp. ctmTa7]
MGTKLSTAFIFRQARLRSISFNTNIKMKRRQLIDYYYW